MESNRSMVMLTFSSVSRNASRIFKAHTLQVGQPTVASDIENPPRRLVSKATNDRGFTSRPRLVPSALLVASFAMTTLGSFAATGFSQVVRLPNQRNFTLNSTVHLPDQGSAAIGGMQTDRLQSNRSPGNLASSRSSSNYGASVHTTVIDLNELDKMIRCHSEEVPVKIKLPSLDSGKSVSQGTVARNKLGCKEQPARYEYMLSMSHDAGSKPTVPKAASLEDARYYLQFADQATRRGEWSSAEFFYNLAWENLPAERRTSALKELLEARAARIAAMNDKAKSIHNQSTSTKQAANSQGTRKY